MRRQKNESGVSGGRSPRVGSSTNPTTSNLHSEPENAVSGGVRAAKCLRFRKSVDCIIAIAARLKFSERFVGIEFPSPKYARVSRIGRLGRQDAFVPQTFASVGGACVGPRAARHTRLQQDGVFRNERQERRSVSRFKIAVYARLYFWTLRRSSASQSCWSR